MGIIEENFHINHYNLITINLVIYIHHTIHNFHCIVYNVQDMSNLLNIERVVDHTHMFVIAPAA